MNLSNGAEIDDQFTKLVEQLRKAPPSNKPHVADESQRSHPHAQATSDVKVFSSDPIAAYEQALTIVQSADMVKWRRLIEASKIDASHRLSEWRKAAETNEPDLVAQLSQFVTGGLECFQTLIACACAAIETEQPKFNRQTALVHDLMEPPSWSFSGSSLLVNIPRAAAWLFQLVSGAMYVHTGQTNLAVELANQKIENRYRADIRPLFLTTHLTGWPKSLNGEANIALEVYMAGG